ncbi:hypothetical protein F2Q70_00023696 [Brassica cretica]|uniref:Uncharacterized protein n=1 Tax=Brassica cretica TaxID=69181 RepID=A0A8S9GQ66_BRACR|nr:hypothetical protein F2Q70_00023696 [Brassica cretica]
MEQPRQTSTASQPPETQSQPSEPAPKPAVLSQIQQPPSTNPNPSSAPSIPSSPAPPSPSLNPNPNPPQYTRPVTSPATQHLPQSLGRPPPPSYSRPWQPHSSYAHFSSSASSSPLLSSSPPGFSSDEIKTFRKPVTTDIHKDRLAAVKKSMTVTEAANARFGHGTANARGGQAKTPANPLASTTFNH